jgi:proline racemase
VPDLGGGSVAAQAERFRAEHDRLRRAVVEEPRGSEVFVGALLVPPADPDCALGVIFFNDVSTLGMCGHGTIGVIASLAALGRVAPGRIAIETPVGKVEAELQNDGRVAIRNVPAWRLAAGVELVLDDGSRVVGEVAWGGNWFFLAEAPAELRLDLSSLEALLAHSRAIRRALERQGVCGDGGAPIDHVELYRAAGDGEGARGFVLCPGAAWDRSPCGTGTSAKLACLAADGKLEPGRRWRQESIIGSAFEAWYQPDGNGRILPTIVGRAHLMARGELLIDPEDPFGWGIGGTP